MAQRRKKPAPCRIIDVPAVVGVDEAKVPDLSPLIKIRHTRSGALDDSLRERIDRAKLRDELGHFGEIATKLSVRLLIQNSLTNDVVACSQASLGSIQLLLILASLIALTMYCWILSTYSRRSSP